MSELPNCRLCQGKPFKIRAHGTVVHLTDKPRPCELNGIEFTPDQWQQLMGVPEPAIVYESLTIKEAKEHLVKVITYAQRANETSGLYKPKLNPKMVEQQ